VNSVSYLQEFMDWFMSFQLVSTKLKNERKCIVNRVR